MTASRHQDPLIYEHLSSDVFWLLGIMLILIGRWTNRQLERSNQSAPKSDTEATQVTSEGHSSQVTATLAVSHRSWLQARITSRALKVFAVLGYLVVLSLQLLEGYWIIQTAWRITVATLTSTFPSFKPYILALILYLPIIAITLACWAGVLAAGFFLVSVQYLYICKLCEIPLASHNRPSYSEELSPRDGRWTDLETGQRMQDQEGEGGGVLLGGMKE